MGRFGNEYLAESVGYANGHANGMADGVAVGREHGYTQGWNEATIHANGVIDERTGRMIEQGASVVGAVFGQATPNLSRDDDYEYQIKFQCR